MVRPLAALAAATFLACATSPVAPAPARGAELEVARALDAWHADAARPDADPWLSHFAPDARIWRADRHERWDVAQLESYTRASFAEHRRPDGRVQDRKVTVAPSGEVAWFEERGASAAAGPQCASGMLVRVPGAAGGPATWRVAHCDLLLPRDSAPVDVARYLDGQRPRGVARAAAAPDRSR